MFGRCVFHQSARCMDIMYVNFFNATDMIHAREACVDSTFCPQTLQDKRWKVTNTASSIT